MNCGLTELRGSGKDPQQQDHVQRTHVQLCTEHGFDLSDVPFYRFHRNAFLVGYLAVGKTSVPMQPETSLFHGMKRLKGLFVNMEIFFLLKFVFRIVFLPELRIVFRQYGSFPVFGFRW